MYHQFKELADVDITAEPMEVGPDLPLRDGRRRGRPRHRGSRSCPACSRPARCPAACTARTGSAATRCPTCWSSAGGPALGAAEYVDSLGAATRAKVSDARGRRGRGGGAGTLPTTEGGENPYTLHAELQQTMNDLVGIIRSGDGDRGGARRGSRSSRSAPSGSRVEGHRPFNPGWHLALDLTNMLIVSECVARAALEREESPRRSHPRRLPGDEPGVAQGEPRLPRSTATGVAVDAAAAARDAAELLELFDVDELTQVHDRRGARRACQEGGRTDGLHAPLPGLARRRHRRRARGLRRRGQRGRGRPRHHPPAAGDRRRPTSRCGGTARPASAARAAPRSTAARG